MAGLPVEFFTGNGLKAALASTPHLDAALLIRSHQIFVTASSIRRLLQAFQRTRLPIAASRYDHTTGLPALFSRTLFSDLLSGIDPKQVIREHSSQLVAVLMPEAAANFELAELRN